MKIKVEKDLNLDKAGINVLMNILTCDSGLRLAGDIKRSQLLLGTYKISLSQLYEEYRDIKSIEWDTDTDKVSIEFWSKLELLEALAAKLPANITLAKMREGK